MKKTLLIGALFLAPSVALADVTNLIGLIGQLQNIINALIPLLFGVALLGFLVGVIRYIWAAGNPQKIKEARGFIVFSIIGIAVMLSVWSLALFVKGSFFPNAPAGINFNTSSIGGGSASSSGGQTGGQSSSGGQTGGQSSSGGGDCSQDGSDGSSCGGGAGHCQSQQCIYDCSQEGVSDGATCNTSGGTCQGGQCSN